MTTANVASAIHAARHKPGAADGLDAYGYAQEYSSPWRHPRFISQSTARMAGSADFPSFTFQTGQNPPRMFKPSILRTTNRIPNPINGATYYLYASTDHGTNANASGIFLWTANNLTGPWTPVGSGPVYVDPDSNTSQTEFPSIVWNPDTRQFHLYYIFFIAYPGYTSLAVSSDGVTWEKVSNSVFHGNTGSYTGYGSITRLGPYNWFANHLLGQTGAAQGGGYTTARSRDGIQWVTDPMFKQGGIDTSLDTGRSSIGPTQLFTWNGQLWGLGSTKRSDTSGGQPGDQEVVAGPVSADMRSFIIRPQQVWAPSHQWELGVYHSAGNIFKDDDGSLWLPYRGGDGSGFGIAKASAVEGVGGN